MKREKDEEERMTILFLKIIRINRNEHMQAFL